MKLTPTRVVFTIDYATTMLDCVTRARFRHADEMPHEVAHHVIAAFEQWQRNAIVELEQHGGTNTVMSSRAFGDKLPKGAVVVGITDLDGMWRPLDPSYQDPPVALLELGCACGLADVPACRIPHEATMGPARWPKFDLHVDLRGMGFSPDALQSACRTIMALIDTLSVDTDDGIKYIKARFGASESQRA